MTKTVKGIIAVGVVLVIATILIAVLTTGNSLEVINGNATFTADSDNALSAKSGQAYVFYCNTADFKVDIKASADCQMKFAVDNGKTQPVANENLTDGLDIQKIENDDNGFILFIPQGISIENILQKSYEGHSLEFFGTAELTNLLRIVVATSSGAVTINLNFEVGQ